MQATAASEQVPLWLDACRPGGGIGPIFIEGNYRTPSSDCVCSNCCNCSTNAGCAAGGLANNASQCPVDRTTQISSWDGSPHAWPASARQVVREAGVRVHPFS